MDFQLSDSSACLPPYRETTLIRLPVQPRELKIERENPFGNDLLDRKKPIETLTNVLSNVGSPCILSVDAPWGAGKTTFLSMWEKYLKSQGFAVIEFNAWKTDFSDDPFLALASELTSQLTDVEKTDSFASELKALTNDAKKIAANNASNLFGAVTSIFAASAGLNQDPGTAAVVSAASNIAEGLAERLFLSHEEVQHSVSEFSEKLTELAGKISKRREGRPVVIMIDELDRCRPTYAIELLENAKHIFSVENVAFVLATNRSELSQSVRAIYGQGFGGEEYLERFFDISFNLPHQDRRKFIEHTIESTSISFKERTIRWTFECLLNESNLNLRSIAKAIHHLNLVAAAQGKNDSLQIDVASMLMLFRATSIESYRYFIEGRMDESQIADNFLTGANLESFSDPVHRAVFECVLTSANNRIRETRVDSSVIVNRVASSVGVANLLGIDRSRLEIYAEVILGTGSIDYAPIDFRGLLESIELLSE